MRETFQDPLVLQTHHLRIIADLTSRAESRKSPLKIARENADRIARSAPAYLLDNLEYREQLELAVAAAINAYRQGKVQEIPDGKADLICVNCHNSQCPDGVETNIRIARQLVIKRTQEWERYGIGPLNPDTQIIRNPQMELIRAYELSRG